MSQICDECGEAISKAATRYEIILGLNHYDFCSEKCLRKFASEGKGKYNSFYA